MTTKSWLVKFGALALFLTSFGVLLPGIAPHVTSGDSPELALAGATLGVAHSPGYPVFTLLQHAFTSVMPIGNMAFRQSVMGAILISASLVLLALLLVRTSGQRWAVLLPSILLMAPLFRKAGHTTEVFPLVFFWAALILVCTFLFSKRNSGLLLISFLMGLGIAIHQTLILMSPAVLYFYWKNHDKPAENLRKMFLPSLLAFGGGLSIFLYLPIRSAANPLLDWEDPETLGRFWGVITRSRYGFMSLSRGQEGGAFSFEAFVTAFQHIKTFYINNLGWVGLFLMAIGALQSLSRRHLRRFMMTCLLHLFFTGPVFFWLAGVSLGPDSDVLVRFGFLPLMGGALLVALGLSVLWSSEIPLYRGFMLVLLSGFFIEVGYRNKISTGHDHLRWDLSIREAGLNMLRTVPENATLFCDRADETEFSLAYLLNAEGRRPDIRFVDCNAGVTKSIYGDDYYNVWGRPRLDIREKVESKIVNSSTSPVLYATIDPAMIDVYRTSRGLLYRAWPHMTPATINATPWHKILAWRTNPEEYRSRGFFRTNLDLLARDLFEKEHYDGALDMFGLVQKQGGPNRWEQMGYWYQVRGAKAKAHEAYAKAEAAGDESEAFYSNYGALYSDKGQLVSAIQIYEKGLNIHPNSTKLLYNLAVARWETGSYDESIRLAQRVLDIDPGHVHAARLVHLRPNARRI